MVRSTIFDANLGKYVMLKSRQTNIIETIGRLEDEIERRDPATYGEYITRLRRSLHQSQDSFAVALSIKPVTLKTIESGKHLPSYQTFQTMSSVFQLSLDELRRTFRRYAFQIKDEFLDYLIDQQDDSLVDPVIYQQIGELIQAERRFMSISRKTLASKTGKSIYVLTKIESGEHRLMWSDLSQIATFIESNRLREVSEKLHERISRTGRQI